MEIYLYDGENVRLPPFVDPIELLWRDINDNGPAETRPCTLWMGNVGSDVYELPSRNGVCYKMLDRKLIRHR